MMHGREKSDPAIVAMKPTNKAGATGGGVGGAKGGGRGERGPAKHAPDAEPGKRVTGAGPRTGSRKAKEEGTVHCAPPPSQRRPARAGVLCAEARCGARGGWSDVAGLRGRPRAQTRGPARSGFIAERIGRCPHGDVHTETGRSQRPLAVAALEDKIVQRATVAVLNAIYEEDFLGFSYGFRPGAQPARCAGCAGRSGSPARK